MKKSASLGLTYTFSIGVIILLLLQITTQSIHAKQVVTANSQVIQTNQKQQISPLVSQVALIETNKPESTTSAAPTTPLPKFYRILHVQTDTEQPIPNHQVICKELPKKLDAVTEDEVKIHEFTTNNSGIAIVGSNNPDNLSFTCSSKEPITTDYCWYFPNATQFFDVFQDEKKNKPIYLVGLASPNTCNKEFSPIELEDGITKFLPSGTPVPFQNRNIEFNTPTATPAFNDINVDEKSIKGKLLTWQWFIQTLKSIFRF